MIASQIIFLVNPEKRISADEINNFFYLSGFLKAVSNNPIKFYQFFIEKIVELDSCNAKSILEISNSLKYHSTWILKNLHGATNIENLRGSVDCLMKFWFCGMHENITNSIAKTIGKNFIWIFNKFQWSFKEVDNYYIIIL